MLWSGQLPGVRKPEGTIPAIPQAGTAPTAGVPPGASLEPIRMLGRRLSAPKQSWAEQRQARVDARNAEKAAGRAESRAAVRTGGVPMTPISQSGPEV